MKFEVIFFDWYEEIEYERHIIDCNTYDEMLSFAERRCKKIMIERDLQDICWNYTEVM